MSAARWAVLLATGLVSAVGSALVLAPASYADLALDRASLGRIRLADTSGTLWNGSGRVVITDGNAGDRLAGSQGLTLSGMAVPSRIGWSLRAVPLMIGIVDASLTIDPARPAVRVSGTPTELRVGAGGFSLPSADLARLGSPWNTIKPVAALSMRWDALTLRQGVLDGRASIELRDAASAMSPVRPLGSYRIEINGNGREIFLTLSTLSGSLRLQGTGSWDRRAGVRFDAQAQAQGAQQAALQSLLSLVGRRAGDKTIIKIGG
ncbi:MAG: type II secretion system protein N [Quisquiliibacterium sp.]